MAGDAPTSIEIPSDAEGEILPAIARARITAKLKRKKDEITGDLSAFLSRKAGVYVTIRQKSGGELRGSLGTIEPESDNLVEETRNAAFAAAFEDPRFKNVMGKELDDLKIEVSIIGEPQRAESIADLDPEVYGAILTSRTSGKRGIMLPKMPGLRTVDQQLAAIRRECEIRPDEDLRLQRFRVETYSE